MLKKEQNTVYRKTSRDLCKFLTRPPIAAMSGRLMVIFRISSRARSQTARSLSDVLAGRLAGAQAPDDMAAQETETEAAAFSV